MFIPLGDADIIIMYELLIFTFGRIFKNLPTHPKVKMQICCLNNQAIHKCGKICLQRKQNSPKFMATQSETE
jgi:hypothetical protein